MRAKPIDPGKRFLTPFLWVLLTVAAAQADDRPNIVFILADDVGCEPIGCYGGTSFQTPAIDRLADEGMKFNHCYSMPVCHPSRTTLLLGRYPRHTGNPRWGSFPAQLESETFAHSLKRAGYSTAVAGKWQLTLLGRDPQHPRRLGFDSWCLFGWHEGPRYHDPMIWQDGTHLTGTDGKYGPDLYVDFLIDFIQSHQDQPFLAFYSMALCHDVTDDLDQPVPYAPGKDRYLNYGEMVQSMDQCVGRLMGALDRLRLRERTLVIFTGDNGTAARSIIRAEPASVGGKKKWKYIRQPVACEVNGRLIPGGKGLLTDTGTRVPLICSWPSRIPAGTTSNDLVDFSDFLPTFSELAKQPAQNRGDLDGHSFAKRLTRNEPTGRKWAYAERGEHWFVRTQRWKLYDDGRLYDIGQDPVEARDLARQRPAAAEKDWQLLEAARRDLIATPK